MATATHTAGVMLALECIVCGAPFHHIPIGRGRYPRFCSQACRQARIYRQPARHRFQCVECGREGEASKPSAKYCGSGCKTAAKRRRNPRRKTSRGVRHQRWCICKACAVVFSSKGESRKRYCSEGCRAAWKAAHRPPPSFSVYRMRCEECCVRVDGKQSGTRFCSPACNARFFHKQATEEKRAERTCPECAVVFIPEYGRAHSTYCSTACATRRNRRVRRKIERARLRGAKTEPVDPIKVFDRDGWRCHMCGVKTPRRLRGSFKDKAPELDHIIPLAKGGEHSYRNTACSCRKCNGAKADSSKGQLRLFG